MSVNRIGDDGAKSLSEILKLNTTLTKLNMEGEEERKEQEKKERNKDE